MNAVFTDSGYFIGRLDRHDFLHQRATTLAAKYDAQVTTEFVLLEVLNALSGPRLHLRTEAARWCNRLRAQPNIIIYPCSTRFFNDSLAFYQSRADKHWSLTDCASFIVMHRLGLTSALTADKHFVQAGFEALLLK